MDRLLVSSDLIVSGCGEFNQVETIPKWISHIGNFAVLAFPGRSIKRCTTSEQLPNCLVEVVNDKVEVNRGHMSVIGAR